MTRAVSHSGDPTFVSLNADVSMFTTQDEADAVLAAWLTEAWPDIDVLNLDLVTDEAHLSPQADLAHRCLLELYESQPRAPHVGHWLTSVDLGDPPTRLAVARFAYWSIDVVILFKGIPFTEFFEATDTGSWAAYRLPANQLARFRGAFPSWIAMPAEWVEIFEGAVG